MIDIIQGSDEWFAIRCGKVTASRIADLMAKTKSGWGASRKNYAAQLLAERLSKTVGQSFTNAAMQWGTDTEPEARQAYEFIKNVAIEEIGFIEHPTIKKSGASPDGLIGDDGMIEIKCPNTATHLETLLGSPIDKKYVFQMQWQMACAERKWCDFVSYDPRLPPAYNLYVERVARDEEAIADIAEHVAEFLRELDEREATLRNTYEPVNVLEAG